MTPKVLVIGTGEYLKKNFAFCTRSYKNGIGASLVVTKYIFLFGRIHSYGMKFASLHISSDR